MKNCNDIAELMSLYIDKELDEATCLEFEQHVGECQTCKEDLEAMMQLIQLCSHIPEEELPDDFKQNLHSRLVEEQQIATKKIGFNAARNRYLKVFASIAAVLLMVVLLRDIADINFYIHTASSESAKSDEGISEAVGQPSDAPRPETAQSAEDMADKPVESIENPKASSKAVQEDQEVNPENGSGEKAVSSKKTYNVKPSLAASIIKAKAERNSVENNGAKVESLENGSAVSSINAVEDVQVKGNEGFGGLETPSVDITAFDETYVRNTNVLIKSVKPGEVAGKIEVAAAVYGGELNDQKSICYDNTGNKIPTGIASFGSYTMSVKISTIQKDNFINELKKAYKPEEIEIKGLTPHEAAVRTDYLNTALEGIKNKINGYDESRAGFGTLDKLIKSRELLEQEIRSFYEDNGYVFILITVN